MKDIIIQILNSDGFKTKAKTYLWQTVVGFISLFVFFLQVLQPEVVDPLMLLLISASTAGLNTLTKYINKTYF